VLGEQWPLSPFSYFKTTQGEGGVKPPLVVKLPGTSDQTQTDIVDAFVDVNEMTPTFLEYAGVQTIWSNIQR
jgi:arylsulfatase A-like enzyme